MWTAWYRVSAEMILQEPRVIILEGKGPAQNNTDAMAITQPNPSIDCAAEHHFAFGFLPDQCWQSTGTLI